MVPTLRTLLVGRNHSRFQRNLEMLGAATLLVATFVAYALDVFEVSGGVVVLPQGATLVGFLAAMLIGYGRDGLVFAWLHPAAAYAGFRADWAFLGLSSHSPGGKLAFLFDPVGLVVLVVSAVLVGSVGFAVGYLGQLGVALVRGARTRRADR